MEEMRDEEKAEEQKIVQEREHYETRLEAAGVLTEVMAGLDAAVTLIGVPVLGRPEVVVEIEANAVQG